MNGNKNLQPIFVLPEGTLRSSGKSALRANIAAAREIADTVRTTLGPKGMDKMLVDSLGDIVITNDGATILDEMEIEHPAAKMVVEVAKVQDQEVGDGTTTAVVLAGELLKEAEQLLEKNVHPTVIASGYNLAEKQAQKILPSLGRKVTAKDKDLLQKIAMTAMTGKNVEWAREQIAKIVVDSVLQVIEGNEIDRKNIKIEKKTGKRIDDTQLIQGVVVDKERVHSNMPKSVKDAKILLLDVALEIKDTETDAKIEITSPDQLEAFSQKEEHMLRDMADKVVATGASVVFCQKGIDDLVSYFLAKKGILATRRVKESDMAALSKATGASILSNLNEMSERDLGSAGLIEEEKIGDENMIFVKDCKNPKAVTILIRGGTEHVIAEVERSVIDALGDIIATITVQLAAAGGGAIEVELSKKIREFAQGLEGKQQLAVLSFAAALESIPLTLAENAGLDPIDILTKLKAEHDSGKASHGINVLTSKIEDTWVQGIIEPIKIKTQAISSATEVATLLLRIDDVIAASKLSGRGGGGPAHPPEMEGY